MGYTDAQAKYPYIQNKVRNNNNNITPLLLILIN